MSRSLTLVLAALLFMQCNPVSKLGKNEYLLVKNVITLEKESQSKIAKPQIKATYETVTQLDDYIQQKPNTKMLGIIKFHLAVYNFTTRRQRKKQSKNLDLKVTEEIETTINKIIGEPPVLVDAKSVEKTVQQMQLSLYNKGFFNNEVRDSIAYKNYLKHEGGRAKVYYRVDPGPRYVIGKLNHQIEDETIGKIVTSDQETSLLKIGENYDEEALDQERDKIVKRLKNEGYFFFSKDYVRFTADTSLGGHSIALTIIIDPFKKKTTSGFKETAHKKYKIKNIYIQPDFYPEEASRPLDTVTYGDYNFLIFKESINEKADRNAYIRFKTLSRKVFIRKDEYFKIDNFDNTYRHLAALKIFKFINIQFQKSEKEDELNCLIQLNPIPKHTIQIEAEGTHASGNLGIAENFIYRNKNIFKGAETLEISIKAGLEGQKTFAGETESIDELGLFNTVEAGPELKVNFPRLLFPIKEEMIPKRYDPKTSLRASYNYQVRSDYTRWIWEGGFTYEWKESARKTHVLAPFNISSVKIKDDSPILDSTFSNAFLRNSFTNHFISATRYSFIYTSQQLNRKVNFTYFRGNVEVAGNFLRGASRVSDAPADSTYGSYSIFGIKYAQYLRADIDVRNYNFINRYSTIVFRFAAGLGLPYGNSTVMPFEKSYFAGGANGLRAWQARNIGPGAYNGKVRFDQIADVKLEANIESRFEFLGPLEGAAFIDAGNIWLTLEDPDRPGGVFAPDKFLNEIAMGAGLGIRLNYNYFIIRVDAAVRIKDPREPVGQRWVHPYDSFSDINYNLGIGYPF